MDVASSASPFIAPPERITEPDEQLRAAIAQAEIPPLLKNYVFSDFVETPIVKNTYGDSSGVRGAAWLWPVT